MLEPMLASPTTHRSGRKATDFRALMASGLWIADTKIDGVRCVVRIGDGKIEMRNRNGVTINDRYPELHAHFSQELLPLAPRVGAVYLDGEIAAKDGRFETVLQRDKQANPAVIRGMIDTHPVAFVAFDFVNPEALTAGVIYNTRRAMLEQAVPATDMISHSVISRSEDFLETVIAHGLEGVIAKHEWSRYAPGLRSHQWLKFKALSRVTCLVSGYTKGTGHRSEFGAMELAMLDGGGSPVSVGRVGTGFNNSEIKFLKLALDRGDLLTVEIECLGRTGTDQLRQPVYIGVRTDVDPHACTTDQLNHLAQS